MREARRHGNLNLYLYVDKAYSSSVVANCSMYIGVHELCHLTSKVPCDIGKHFECTAQKTVEAYNAMKVRSERRACLLACSLAGIAIRWGSWCSSGVGACACLRSVMMVLRCCRSVGEPAWARPTPRLANVADPV
jgi:hypothetical protein